MKIKMVKMLGIVAIAGAVSLFGCGKQPGTAEKTGAAVDKATDKTVEAVKTTADKTGEAVEKAGKAVKKTGEETQE